MSNTYGLDVNYFKGKLKILLRDLDNYTPREFQQELKNMNDALAELGDIINPKLKEQHDCKTTT